MLHSTLEAGNYAEEVCVRGERRIIDCVLSFFFSFHELRYWLHFLVIVSNDYIQKSSHRSLTLVK